MLSPKKHSQTPVSNTVLSTDRFLGVDSTVSPELQNMRRTPDGIAAYTGSVLSSLAQQVIGIGSSWAGNTTTAEGYTLLNLRAPAGGAALGIYWSRPGGVVTSELVYTNAYTGNTSTTRWTKLNGSASARPFSPNRDYVDAELMTYVFEGSSQFFTAKGDLNRTDFPGGVIPAPTTGGEDDENWQLESYGGTSITKAYVDELIADLQAQIDTLDAGGGHILQDEGTAVPQRANLNFVGNNVALTDDEEAGATVITFTSLTEQPILVVNPDAQAASEGFSDLREALSSQAALYEGATIELRGQQVDLAQPGSADTAEILSNILVTIRAGGGQKLLLIRNWYVRQPFFDGPFEIIGGFGPLPYNTLRLESGEASNTKFTTVNFSIREKLILSGGCHIRKLGNESSRVVFLRSPDSLLAKAQVVLRDFARIDSGLTWDTNTVEIIDERPVSNGVTQADGDARWASLGHTHSNATPSVAGFMSSTDKAKLDGLNGTNTYTDAQAVTAATTAGVGDAKPWVAGAQRLGQLSYSAGAVYRAKVAIANSQTAPESNLANYELVGPGAGSKHTIQDEGTDRTSRTKLNFLGDGVTVTDNATTGATDVTIPGGGGGDTYGALAYAATLTVDFTSTNSVLIVSAAGNLTFGATSNRAQGRARRLYVTNTSGSAIILTANASWMRNEDTVSIPAGKTALISLACETGTAETNVAAALVVFK